MQKVYNIEKYVMIDFIWYTKMIKVAQYFGIWAKKILLLATYVNDAIRNEILWYLINSKIWKTEVS